MTDLKNNFLFPPDEFSPVPFWFLNDELSKEELKRQLFDFFDKGIRAVVLHPRKGLPLSAPYLSEEFLDYIEYITELAESLGMKVILYDEAMYPSGSCNGQVVKENPSLAAKGLRKCTYKKGDPVPVFGEGNWFVSAALSYKDSDGNIAYKGYCNMADMIADYEKSAKSAKAMYFTLVYSHGTIRGVHPGEDDGEINAPGAADLLDIESAKAFLRLTHDVYYKRLKKYFGNTVISFFTDEPSIMGRNHIKGLIPWTHGFLPFYLENGGALKDIPLLFEKESSESKSIYSKAVNKLMARNYFEPISRWCEDHGVMLSGHPASSEDIGFLKYFHLPCQDLVWRYIDPDLKNSLIGPHSTMGKCSSDSARHRGRRRNGNECFGACGYKKDPLNLPFKDMMWYMNWLFVRGVNMLIPHAFFYSLRGDRINERPPDVGPNSPWWSNYSQIASYISRLSWLNTDSVNITDIAVLCSDDHLPWKSVANLYENQKEFNYLECELLKDCTVSDKGLQIKNQCYRLIIIQDGLIISDSEKEVLSLFEAKGGRVVNTKDFSEDEILAISAEYNPTELKIIGRHKDLRVSHTVKEGTHFYLIFNEDNSPVSFEASVCINGKKELWDPWNGTFKVVSDSNKFSLNINAYELLILTVSE